SGPRRSPSLAAARKRFGSSGTTRPADERHFGQIRSRVAHLRARQPYTPTAKPSCAAGDCADISDRVVFSQAGWLHMGAVEGRSPVVSFRLPAFGPTHMVLTLALLLLGLFAYAFFQTAAQSYRLREAERELLVQVQDLRQQRAELEGLAAYLESDEYIEAFARQQFGLVKPGETLVEVDAPQGAAGTRKAGERWWEALFDTASASG